MKSISKLGHLYALSNDVCAISAVPRLYVRFQWVAPDIPNLVAYSFRLSEHGALLRGGSCSYYSVPEQIFAVVSELKAKASPPDIPPVF